MVGLEFHGRHGLFPEEERLGARFIVDVDLLFNFDAIEDRMEDSVDYGAVYESVRAEVTAKRYYLIEVLANRIAERLLSEFDLLEALVVRVHKPHAPLPGVFRDVYAEVERRRA
nr:dihydroneopterin aldolase [Deinobacterium chartae]